jgi:hypothetical protein
MDPQAYENIHFLGVLLHAGPETPGNLYAHFIIFEILMHKALASQGRGLQHPKARSFNTLGLRTPAPMT